jgi:hypothetical protein
MSGIARFINSTVTLVGCRGIAYVEKRILVPVDDSRHFEAARLKEAVVAAFPHYAWERLDELGVVAGSTVNAAIKSAVAELERALADLLSQPEDEQNRSPLELVREATQPVTAALAALGLRPPPRDLFLTETYPEDVYDLYPASSQSLGEEVWRLHLEWGKAKAKRVAGVVPASDPVPSLPAVALFGVPRDERDPIAATVTECGYRLAVWRNPAALKEADSLRPALVLVDLRHPQAHEAIREMAAQGVRVIATGPDVTDLTVPGVMALGAEEAIASERLVGRIDSLLPRLA